MATDVVMPQMGESIAEGTVVRWIKKVGDTVDRDEPLFEISTDKVDAEIPSPVAGVITEIRANEGQTVEVNTVVAVIGEAGSKPTAAAPPPQPKMVDETPTPPPPSQTAVAPEPVGRPAASHHEKGEQSQAEISAAHEPDTDRSTRSSPLVRKIAKEHQIDISQI